ncbi:MAC/Perforin domain-containing protein [Aspergillus alliaceus]|uniref:MAC/Perforin domain-containing protein n=1 Tax=Petromyces alliaceus TaxID=209559 RepID=UPI0012A6C69A|nr:MAC/Perforin domain-containing protein [Aspergillus alliaceus]KAB8231129.1 MAC/Perforin domain-containing protein [Aspergillus alliaceus]
MARDLDTSASLSASYAGFSASASAQNSYSSSLSSNKYYAMLSVDHSSSILEFEGHEGTDPNINPGFVEAAKQLPEWEVKDEVYGQYVRFFRSWGTHVIKSSTFGARYQLKVENESSKSKSKEILQAQVSAEYNGLASVKGDACVKSAEEYKAYHTNSRQFQARVYGGSSSTNIILSNAPDDLEKYRKAFDDWAPSLDNAVANNLVSVRVDSIGNILKNSLYEEHRQISGRLLRALEYLSQMRLSEGVLKLSTKLTEDGIRSVLGARASDAPGISLKGADRHSYGSLLFENL